MARQDETTAIQQMNYKTATVPVPIVAHADGHSFPNANGDLFLRVINGGGVPVTVDVPSTQTIGSQALGVDDVNPSVAAGADAYVGPFSPSIFNQIDGTVWVDFSVQASVTFELIKHGDNS